MAGIALFTLWVGYSVLYWGLDHVRGGNDGFLDLVSWNRNGIRWCDSSKRSKDAGRPALTDAQLDNGGQRSPGSGSGSGSGSGATAPPPKPILGGGQPSPQAPSTIPQTRIPGIFK